MPHAGELLGPESVERTVRAFSPVRLGHGVRASEDQRVLALLAERQIACEVCPASNVALGVAAAPAQVPLRTLLDAGVPVALGADDPLLFGSRLTAQYELARHVHGLADPDLAELARMSVRGSVAPAAVAARLLAGIDRWLTTPAT